MKAWGGVLSGLLIAVLMFGVLSVGTEAPVENPNSTIPFWFWMPIVIVGGWWVIQMWSGKFGLGGLLIAVAIGAALLWLNGTPHMPNGGENPCPGDEVIVYINGQCYGMDADANADWLEGKLGGGQ